MLESCHFVAKFIGFVWKNNLNKCSMCRKKKRAITMQIRNDDDFQCKQSKKIWQTTHLHRRIQQLIGTTSNLFCLIHSKTEIYWFLFTAMSERHIHNTKTHTNTDERTKRTKWSTLIHSLLTNINKNIINCKVLHKNKERKDWWAR